MSFLLSRNARNKQCSYVFIKVTYNLIQNPERCHKNSAAFTNTAAIRSDSRLQSPAILLQNGRTDSADA